MMSIVWQVFQFVRRIALAVIVTFGRSSFIAQLMFVNACSIVAVVYVAHFKPFKSKGKWRVELWNEFTLLMLYCYILTQTDFV